MLFGRNAPATFPPGGVAGAAAPLTGSDALDAIDKGMSAVEASGLTPNGVAADSTIGGALRAAYREVRALPSETPEPTVYGLPVRVVSPWDGSGDALVGDWSCLLVGIREDIAYTESRDATLLDESGEIVVSAFQDDMTLVRLTFRVGCVIGKPVAADGSATNPFVSVEWSSAPETNGGEEARRATPTPKAKA